MNHIGVVMPPRTEHPFTSSAKPANSLSLYPLNQKNKDQDFEIESNPCPNHSASHSPRLLSLSLSTMSTSASTHPQPQASTETPENATLSQIIRPLEPKSKLKSTAFNRVMQALTARDEAIRRETSYWKTQYEVMEKKHGEAALEKLIALDELAKCMRLLEKNQAPRAGTDQRVLIERPEEDFIKAEKQNAKLSCKSENSKVSALESEKENAELSCKVSASESESEKEKVEEGDKRRFEELNGRVSSPRLPKPVYGQPSGPSVLDIFDRQHQLGKQLEAFQMEQREFRDETRNRFGRIDESLQNLTNYFSAYPPQTKTDKGSPVIIGIYDSDDEMPSRKRGSCNDDDDSLKPTKKCHSNSFQEVMNVPDDSDSSDQFDALRGTSVGK